MKKKLGHFPEMPLLEKIRPLSPHQTLSSDQKAFKDDASNMPSFALLQKNKVILGNFSFYCSSLEKIKTLQGWA